MAEAASYIFPPSSSTTKMSAEDTKFEPPNKQIMPLNSHVPVFENAWRMLDLLRIGSNM